MGVFPKGGVRPERLCEGSAICGNGAQLPVCVRRCFLCSRAAQERAISLGIDVTGHESAPPKWALRSSRYIVPFFIFPQTRDVVLFGKMKTLVAVVFLLAVCLFEGFDLSGLFLVQLLL